MRCSKPLRLLVVATFSLLGACATLTPSEKEGEAAALVKPAIDPEEIQAQREFLEALESMEGGKAAEAEKLWLAMTQRHPKFAGPYCNLGILYYRKGKLAEAEAVLKKGLEANSKQVACANELGIVLRESGRFSDARAAYEQALAADDNYAKAHLNLGILYDLYLGDPAQALGHYQRYQDLTGSQDKLVAKWIVDLKQRMSKPVVAKEKG